MPSQPISERKFLAIDGREARCWTSEAFRLPSDKGNNGDVLQLRLRGAPVSQPAVKLSSSISFPRVISLLVLSIIFIIFTSCVVYIYTFSYQVVVFSGRP